MPYSVRANLDQIFGTANITDYADLDNDQDADKIAARVTGAIVVADAKINAVARLVGYKIPIQDESGSTPTLITEYSAELAGLWLYEARGSKDFDPKTGRPYHRLAFKRTEARRFLEDLRAGRLKLDAVFE